MGDRYPLFRYERRQRSSGKLFEVTRSFNSEGDCRAYLGVWERIATDYEFRYLGTAPGTAFGHLTIVSDELVTTIAPPPKPRKVLVEMWATDEGGSSDVLETVTVRGAAELADALVEFLTEEGVDLPMHRVELTFLPDEA